VHFEVSLAEPDACAGTELQHPRGTVMMDFAEWSGTPAAIAATVARSLCPCGAVAFFVHT
jgi:hypothetical protein